VKAEANGVMAKTIETEMKMKWRNNLSAKCRNENQPVVKMTESG
jgi:hypothetical protein